MKSRFCIAAAVLVLTLAVPARAGFEEGLAAYQEGDYATALKEWQPLAEAGNAVAQHNLGIMYEQGHGVAQDPDAALAWYRKAAAQGYGLAQYTLGVMFLRGELVEQNEAEAELWLRRGAEQGHPEAQALIGSMIAEGLAPPTEDAVQAATWYHEAAERGNPRSQLRLGTMYFAGTGVPQSYMRAHQWLNLAASLLPAGEDRDAAIAKREEVAEKLTRDQLIEAQRRATDWWQSNKTSALSSGRVP